MITFKVKTVPEVRKEEADGGYTHLRPRIILTIKKGGDTLEGNLLSEVAAEKGREVDEQLEWTGG